VIEGDHYKIYITTKDIRSIINNNNLIYPSYTLNSHCTRYILLFVHVAKSNFRHVFSEIKEPLRAMDKVPSK
jgi:hypothetical protein